MPECGSGRRFGTRTRLGMAVRRCGPCASSTGLVGGFLGAVPHVVGPPDLRLHAIRLRGYLLFLDGRRVGLPAVPPCADVLALPAWAARRSPAAPPLPLPALPARSARRLPAVPPCADVLALPAPAARHPPAAPPLPVPLSARAACRSPAVLTCADVLALLARSGASPSGCAASAASGSSCAVGASPSGCAASAASGSPCAVGRVAFRLRRLCRFRLLPARSARRLPAAPPLPLPALPARSARPPSGCAASAAPGSSLRGRRVALRLRRRLCLLPSTCPRSLRLGLVPSFRVRLFR